MAARPRAAPRPDVLRPRRRGPRPRPRLARRRGAMQQLAFQLAQLAFEVREAVAGVAGGLIAHVGAECSAAVGQRCRISTAISATCVGVRPTRTPFASSASAFAAAVPCEPDTIAPAWPIVFPGGAVKPAMYPTTGFVTFWAMNSAAPSSAEPPIS